MAYQIEEYSDRIEIAIDAPPAERGSFLDLLDACTQGERACPALRCGTVETRALADGTLRIKVMPLPDMQLDRQLIERCLAFTLGCGKRCCAGGSA